MRRLFALFLAIAASAGSAAAQTVHSLASVRETYKDVVVVEIASGKAVYATGDPASFCYYHNQGKITDVVRGARKPADFSFDTMSGLELGSGYLIFVSDADARDVFRMQPWHFQQECERRHTGYYFLYDEVNRIKRFSENGRSVDRVKISGPVLEEDFKGPHVQPESEGYIDLDYVKEKLK